MADTRVAFAGDLTTDALGKRVEVTTASGVVIEDVLLEVRYFTDPRATTSDAEKQVWLRFKNVMPTDELRNFEGGNGFLVSHISHASIGSSPEGQKDA